MDIGEIRGINDMRFQITSCIVSRFRIKRLSGIYAARMFFTKFRFRSSDESRQNLFFIIRKNMEFSFRLTVVQQFFQFIFGKRF